MSIDELVEIDFAALEQRITEQLAEARARVVRVMGSRPWQPMEFGTVTGRIFWTSRESGPTPRESGLHMQPDYVPDWAEPETRKEAPTP